MNVFFIGSVLFSRSMLKVVIDIEEINIIGIATKENSKFNSDHPNLSDIAISNNIPYKYVDDINSKKTINWILKLSPDVIYCFGWSSLIKKELLSIPKFGVIGYHPTKLPYNRGRHPIIWSLVLGLKETASTFFRMDVGADSGDIISQVNVKITQKDNASSLYQKLISVSKNQVKIFSINLIRNQVKWIKQSDLKTNYWRKRSKSDGKINFNSNSITIFNLVRALTKPYVGAHVLYKENEIKVWNCRLGPKKDINLESGKILKIENKKILVKTADASIWLVDHNFNLLPKINSYMS